MITNLHHLTTPIQIIQTNLGIPENYKQECVDELYRLGDSQSKATNVKATMTSYAIWDESKVFTPLLQKITDYAKKQGLLGYTSNKKKEEEYDYIYNCQGAIYKKDDFTIEHNHTPAVWSFVYYLKSTGNTPLMFPKSNFKLHVKDDELVIFPGYVLHSVPKHDNNDDRILIAGNFGIPSV